MVLSLVRQKVGMLVLMLVLKIMHYLLPLVIRELCTLQGMATI